MTSSKTPRKSRTKEPSAFRTQEMAKDDKREGVALCMSGGGYRAMVYHVGALWRLNEAGWLARIDIVSSVSGGSITSGALAAAWEHLEFDEHGVATNFYDLVVKPVQKMASRTIDIQAALAGLFVRPLAARMTARAYDKVLLKGRQLADLPEHPQFCFNATNLQTGIWWEFTKDRMGDYRIGYVLDPDVPLARAVAASAGFPPVLAPAVLDTHGMEYERVEPDYADLFENEWYHGKIPLADGGIYDNLGIEAARRSATVLVSNGSGPARELTQPKSAWDRVKYAFRHRWIAVFFRTFGLINAQVRSLRKRLLFDDEKKSGGPRVGYWHIWLTYSKFRNRVLPVDDEDAKALAGLKTDLRRMDDATFESLVNWGYASCDVVLRAYVDKDADEPKGFPYGRGVAPP